MKETQSKKNSLGLILLLQLAVFMLSFSGVFSKLAGRHPVISWGFIFFYGISMVILFVYALIWQQLLRRLPLSTAYSNRMLTMFWSMLWGALFFQEKITWNMILAAVVLMAGVYMVVTADGK